MQKEDIKFQDSCVFEGMTSIRAILEAVRTGISNRTIRKILFDRAKIKKIGKEIGFLRAVSGEYGFFIEPSDEKTLQSMTLGTSHGGIVAVCGERTIAPLEESMTQIKPNSFYAMIQGIEDPYNFGYSLRALYACGCCGVILPPRNWMSAAGVVARSSAGASELLPVFCAEALQAASLFHSVGYRVICAHERADHILGQCEIKYPVLLVIGGEKRGISRALLDCADLTVRIDYQRAFHASLSAASATTMFSYEIMRQNAT